MAKKSMKDAAAIGTNVFSQLANGNTIKIGADAAEPAKEAKPAPKTPNTKAVKSTKDTKDTKTVKNTKAAQDAKDTKATKNAKAVKNTKAVQDVQDVQDVLHVKGDPNTDKNGVPMERLNLKIPTEIKEYLTVEAAKKSIEQRRNVSLTQYLIELVERDMELHKGK